MIKTNEGAKAYLSTDDYCLNLFSKIGSVFSKAKTYYDNSFDILTALDLAWDQDKETTLKILFWLRDCRGGAGNRETFRRMLNYLAKKESKIIEWNLSLIPKYGRWDDLRSVFDTEISDVAAKMWSDAIRNNDVLAAKWCDRNDAPVRKQLNLKIGDFRRLLASIRKGHIVEYKMCENKWNEINYSHVPSVAMARYTNAFNENDGDRFEEYKQSLKSTISCSKINAKALFPHDCIRTVRYGDAEIANAQFDALPNYLEGTNELIMTICDTSGSMESRISGAIEAIDVSMGISLYCSSKMPAESPLYKRFIGFCSEGSFKDWRGMSFCDAVADRDIFDQAVGSTRIDKALDTILNMAIKKNIPQEYMPTVLLIVSDMQFSHGSSTDDTEVEESLRKWEKKGYKKPKVVYWDVTGYNNFQAKAEMNNVAMVSGFSPAILKSVLTCKRFDPRSIMEEALSKYEVVVE
jgi:hypothetical protein